LERTQISLTAEQATRLRHIAARRGTSMAALIRDAVDRVVRDDEDPEVRWERAMKAIGSAIGPVGNAGEDHDRHLAEAFDDDPSPQ